MRARLSRLVVRVLVDLVLVGLGALVAVVGAFQHLRTVEVAGVDLPVGVVACVAALTVLVRLGALLTGRRSGAVLPLVGWLVVTTTFVVVRPGGDVILTDSGWSYAYLLLGVIVPSTAASLPPVPLRELAAKPGEAVAPSAASQSGR